MKLLEKISGRVKKAALAGFLTFAGASTTSAHPRVGVGVGGPAYVAPRRYYRPVYVGPRYGYGYYRGSRVCYGGARFHCRRYR